MSPYFSFSSTLYIWVRCNEGLTSNIHFLPFPLILNFPYPGDMVMDKISITICGDGGCGTLNLATFSGLLEISSHCDLVPPLRIPCTIEI